MDLLFSFLVLLASACVAQILIDKNEVNRIQKRGIYDQKGEEAGTQIKKVHKTTVRGSKKLPQSCRQADGKKHLTIR